MQTDREWRAKMRKDRQWIWWGKFGYPIGIIVGLLVGYLIWGL